MARASSLFSLFASVAVLGVASIAHAQVGNAPTQVPADVKKQAEKTIDDAKKGAEKKIDDAAKKADDTKKQAEKKLDEAKKGATGEGVKIGATAPNFSLTDTDGKTVELVDLLKNGDKIVVLEWFNPQCPFVVKHHDKNTTFKDLTKKFADKPVIFLAINSGAKGEQGHGLKLNQDKKKDFGMNYPVLLDETGTVGKQYGATRTPHMFVIGKDGKVAYMGAIDDNPSPDEAGKINYVEKALDELLAGTTVTTAETKAYGCTVKYSKK